MNRFIYWLTHDEYGREFWPDALLWLAAMYMLVLLVGLL